MKFAVAVLWLLWCSMGSAQTNLSFFVAPDGNDTNAGTDSAPFATLERARDAIRAARAGQNPKPAADIQVQDGTFYRSQTFDLASSDANLKIAALPTAKPRFRGGARLDFAWFAAVPSNSPVWPRLESSARAAIRQVNLAAHGITNFGTIRIRGMSGLSGSDPGPFPSELFCGDLPLELGRWPNQGSFSNVISVVSTNQFIYAGTRPSRWLAAPDPWYHGYWYYMWADFVIPGAGIATNTSTITLTRAPQSYGMRAGQPWFAFNLLEEIDAPGEYYIDRAQGVLYVFPTTNFSTSELFLSELDSPLIRIQAGTNIVLDGLTFSGGRGDLVTLDSACFNVEIRNSRLLGAGRRGVVLNGNSNRLAACEVAFTGDHGVILSGGNRNALTPARSSVRNCRIHDFGRLSFTYTPGVSVSGVGEQVVHNELFSAPHAAILFSGNEHLLAYNEIREVCKWTSDAGAIYAGRDWGYRGNHLQCNFIHDVRSGFSGYGVHAIYLDDCVSGIEVSSNVVYRVSDNALFNGGGRDNFFFNNVVARCGTFHYGDARGLTSITTNSGDSWNLLQKLRNVNYQQNPWSNAYPALAAIPNDYALLGPYKPPGGTKFYLNAGWTNTSAFRAANSAYSYYALWTKNITNSNPLFVDEAHLDLTLSNTSPALKLPGFGLIPFLAIGVGLPTLTNCQSAGVNRGMALALGWVDPKLDTTCTVYLFYGEADYGRTTNFWPDVVSSNQPTRGPVLFSVPMLTGRPFVGRVCARNQEGETWSEPFMFPAAAAVLSIQPLPNQSFSIRWPTDYVGWRLETLTTGLGVNLSSNWVAVPGSTSTSQVTATNPRDGPGVLYRLVSP